MDAFLADVAAWKAAGCPVQAVPRPEADRAKFYGINYSLAAAFLLEVGKKIVLKGSVPHLCRFCGRRPPEVTFQKEAHALPHALGNKSLTTNYECDDCNDFFGGGIENDLGAWSLPSRWLAQIRGNGGLPTIKFGSKGGWRFSFDCNGAATVSQQDGDDVYHIDESARTATFRLRRDPYHPVGAFKALVKIALTIMPEDILADFTEAMAWIRDPDHTSQLVEDLKLRRVFVPGPRPFDTMQLCLLIRRQSGSDLPYAVLVIAYGNEMLQLVVPCPARDTHDACPLSELPTFPSHYEKGRALTGQLLDETVIDLSNPARVKNDFVKATYSFEAARVTAATGDIRTI